MWNKFCASSWLNTEINILRCTVSKTSKNVADKLHTHTHTHDNIVVLWLPYPYRLITLGSNKHTGEDAPWNSSISWLAVGIPASAGRLWSTSRVFKYRNFNPNSVSLLYTKLSFYALLVFLKNMALINPLTPNDHYSGRTAPLTSKRCILYIYSTNIGTEYFKHGIYSPFFSLQNAVCFIILTYLVPVLFTFYIQSVVKFKKIIPAPKV